MYELGKYKAMLTETKFNFTMNFAQNTEKSNDFAKMIEVERIKGNL